ncbi:hypothetical protein EN781_00165 [Mesorhizobium sp. M4A.F.Ca.ET.090.04.2.1]|uniref:hypothetical protein n=1 Tax=Mesorhizobium sp. M4A.F.Ca.ET.090.04.2.1 TaxID=2496663 RepID=UPI000FCCE07F|nr:hypothetical protein [Mesorhizobium sp. M4A.F.Ca.ET.090.04.2.1]RVC47586.1 hypothetical protein EN781_00165 [Mesorhizobium sp. M4A.F.Ca.ET.090.04.2.1]
MATESTLNTRTYPAGADLSGSQFRFVKLNTSGQVIACSAAGERAIGVLQNTPDAAGKAATVAVAGQTKVRFSASVNPGVAIATNASGDVQTGATGNFVLGTVVENPAGANLIGSIEFQPQAAVP